MDQIKKTFSHYYGMNYLHTIFLAKRELHRLGKSVRRSVPSVNVRNEEDRYLIELMAAGFDKSDFEIDYDNNRLKISAKISEKEPAEDTKYAHKEFTKKAFERTFVVQEKEVDIDKINAHYQSGVLYVSIPKVEKEITKRRIEID